MNLGANGVMQIMNSMGGLKSASSFWASGDRVLLVFPVTGTDPAGNPIIPVAFRYGHNVNFGEDSTFKRSFIPTTSEIDPTTNSPKEPDFAYKVSSLFSALLKGERERAEEQIKNDDTLSEESKKIDLENLEENYKNRRPAVSFLTVKAVTEVFVAKLDANNRLINDELRFDYGSQTLSKTKLGQLISLVAEQGVYIKDSNYVYVMMKTTAGVKKNIAAQADFMAIKEEGKKLEDIYPNFAKTMTELMKSKNPTEESIGAKVYDFKPYELNDFKEAVANYIGNRTHHLKSRVDGNYHEFVRNERNVEALTLLGLAPMADELKKLIEDEDDSEKIVEELGGNEAQTIDLSEAEKVVEGNTSPIL